MRKSSRSISLVLVGSLIVMPACDGGGGGGQYAEEPVTSGTAGMRGQTTGTAAHRRSHARWFPFFWRSRTPDYGRSSVVGTGGSAGSGTGSGATARTSSVSGVGGTGGSSATSRSSFSTTSRGGFGGSGRATVGS